MRPDKKKVRHHDSRKKAEEAKRKAADKERGKPTCPQSQPTDAHGSRQNLEEGDRPTSTSEFGKRNITSNWTKYEIPSSEDESGGGGNLNSDGEEDPNTGESYADVLAGAGGSASLLRLRAEREWEAEERERDSAAQFASDLFSLDLQRLEAAVSCVPLHQQLDIPEEDLDPDTLAMMKQRADSNRSAYDSSSDVAVSVNQKILEALSVKSSPATKPGKAEEGVTEDSESKIVVSHDCRDSGGEEVIKDDVKDLEDWLDDFLDE